MASMFRGGWSDVRLLDAGAGAGALTDAFVRRMCVEAMKPENISVVAYECDESVAGALAERLDACRGLCDAAGISFTASLRREDFIAAAVEMTRGDLFTANSQGFNAAILNPPYRKIRSESRERALLRSVGIEASNLYAGFVALAARLLEDGGEMVAITPRSFCNGPYFKPFRAELLSTMTLKRLHVFESRTAAFRGDGVLQENVIVHAVKGHERAETIEISSSSGESESPIVVREVQYSEVVKPGDTESFIHLGLSEADRTARELMGRLHASLDDLGIQVSTGRVVDFRAAENLRREPGEATAPLIYACHFDHGVVTWPAENSRKPNAIVVNELTVDLLLPAGVYVLTKRFTSKEERRRVVACMFDPTRVQAPFVGFENHLNYFHHSGEGLSENLARGLVAFLNSTTVDLFFRQFSGHTQVNATDLRFLRYPERVTLEELGRRITDLGMEQDELDALVAEVLP
jgi:adenine-specific DNA-methyltransferase